MIFIALAFLAGILSLLPFRELPTSAWGWLLIPAIIIIVFSQRDWLRVMASWLAGYLWCLLVSHLVLGASLAPQLEGKDLLLEGVIDNFPVTKARSTRLLLSVEKMTFQGQTYPSPGRVRINWYYPSATPKVGERWRFLVRLKQPHGFMNPGGFDYEAWLFQHRIRATGYVRRETEPVRLGEAGGWYHWQRLRFALFSGLRDQLSGNNMAGLITALAVGERQDIQPQQWKVLRRTGTAHLMAISGLHIGLLAALGFWLGNRCWRLRSRWLLTLPAHKFAAAMAILFALTYAALAGCSIPTQRALIMVCVTMLMLIRQQIIRPSQVLAQSLMLVLLIDPLSVLSAGFWLSFMAVAIILFGLSGRRHINKVFSMLKMQWVIVLGLLPMTIGLFQQASLVSPLVNIVAIPLVGFMIVPLVLLGCLLLLVHEALAGMLLSWASGLLGELWKLLDWLAQFPHSQIQVAASPVVLALALMGVLLIIAPRGLPMRWVGVLFCLPLFFPLQPRPATGEMWFSLLDVGQGLSAVVHTQRHTLVYDTGPRFSKSFDTGEAVVAPYLRHAGVAAIDMLVVSHSDNDHIGGSASLLKLFPVSVILSSVPHKVSSKARSCHAGQHWQWDGVRFTMLHPSSEYWPSHRRGNNLSCVLRVDSARGSILLTGDIEKEAEASILQQAGQVQADVLVVPHHGSRSSSSTAFIKAVAPRLALYPAGYRNRYHHPSDNVVQRYRSLLIPGYTTARSGRILVTFPQLHHPKIDRYRQHSAHFWNHLDP
jgi:competence protein ComEC